ncbi:hypothetical protein JCM10908_003301 [Rhodotorula pacifica]|uniref:Eos1p n=1 Tax=Rhodotorula pacifica TaxID=1495444 RepID=UPI00317F4FD2
MSNLQETRSEHLVRHRLERSRQTGASENTEVEGFNDRRVPQLVNFGLSGLGSEQGVVPGWLPPILDGRVRFRDSTTVTQRPQRVRSTSSNTLLNGIPFDDRAAARIPTANGNATIRDYPSGIHDDDGGASDAEDALEIAPRARTTSRRPVLPREADTSSRPALRRVVSEQGPTISQAANTEVDPFLPTGATRSAIADSTMAAEVSPNRKRNHIWTPILIFLNFLAVLPGLLGFFYSAARFYSSRHLIWTSLGWDAGGVAEARSTRLDWFISGLWALATAYFTLSLARGLLRRWLVYYTTVPTIIRVVSLQAICWPLTLTTHRVLSFDQPVAAWLICATTAAFCNVIQSWVTSNIVERKDRADRQRWRLFSIAVTAVLGPGVRTDKYRKGERVLSWKRVLWGTALPFALLGWVTTNALLWQQFVARYKGGGGIDLGRPRLNATSALAPSPRCETPGALERNTNAAAAVRVMVLVTSSWTNRSSANRYSFRETSVRLFPRPSTAIAVDYRFLLGTPPSPQVGTRAGPGIAAEADEFGDILLVPAHDTYEHLSKKIYEGWKWASSLDVDYVLKTDDDILLRMDVLAKELGKLGRRREYWRGFAYWDIPAIKDASNKNADFAYDLPTFPPYTAGALHILSKDLVDLITPRMASRLFVKNEDQNLGLWLHASGVRPIHDHRIQQAQVCENDMIAKHFGSQYTEPSGFGAREMYANIVSGRKPCDGFLQRWCGVCYPSCRGRDNHWRSWGFACDDLKGATLSEKPHLRTAATLEAPVRISAEPYVVGSAEDPWILPGILSRHGSPFSKTNDWHLLHMLCWTTSAETFQERHYQAIESIWAHEPRAVLIMFSTSLPADFFADYTRHGYAIHVVPVSKPDLLERHWYFGPQSRGWLEKWDEWQTGPNFFSHLTDYLRYLFLFKYGGTYLDMDAPWIRSPPNSYVEFIGADYSTLASDLDWTLDEDGMYLAPGVMRFRRGWTVFRDAAEHAFSVAYTPDCFGCVGPRAITKAIGARRYQLEQSGLTILPPRVLYPRNWITAHELVRALPAGEAANELARLVQTSWSIHLFGKMTNHLRIQPGSIAAEAFATFNLGVPRKTGLLSSSDAEPARPAPEWSSGAQLHFPQNYTYRTRTALEAAETADIDLVGSLDGRFDGLDLIMVRGVPEQSPQSAATLRFTTSRGGRIVLSAGSGSSGTWARTNRGEADPAGGSATAIRLDPQQTSLRAINSILRGISYAPPTDLDAEQSDCLGIEVEWGGQNLRGRIHISFQRT